MTDAAFFIVEAVRMGRADLSYCDYLRFLRGMLLLVGDQPEVADVRDALIAIGQGDQQLELIASGQLNLKSENQPPHQPEGSAP